MNYGSREAIYHYHHPLRKRDGQLGFVVFNYCITTKVTDICTASKEIVMIIANTDITGGNSGSRF